MAILLLIIAVFMPQDPIIHHIDQSIGGLQSEGLRPDTFDRQESSSLDTFTDIQMLRAAASMHSRNIRSILTNDLFSYSDSADIIEDLSSYIHKREAESVFQYVRYWMGFRAVLRFLLTFLNYFQIRRYLSILFFCLFFALVFHITDHTDRKLACLFALSIILVRPNVIVNTLQYSCCFFIVFISMFLVPWLFRHPKWTGIFFMEIGMITMYFDFYTVPLVTFGYPAIYLLALYVFNEKKTSPKQVALLFLHWFAGWSLMWGAKLFLTSVFTDVNGFTNGFHAFAYRMGIVKAEDDLEYYQLSSALIALFRAIFCDTKGALISAFSITTVCAAVLFKIKKQHIPLSVFRKHKAFLFVAVLPAFWFLLTVQPIAIHAFFQYRSMAVLYWGVGAYLYTGLFLSRSASSHLPHKQLP